MSQIPITREYAAAVGEWCEQVENRSLLHEKFALPKNWGEAVKENSASNWSIMRIATHGSVLLKSKADELDRPGRNVGPEKADAMRAAASVCRALSRTKTGSGLDPLRPKHTARFLELLRATYPGNRLQIIKGRLEGRLAINLADGLIQNAGMALDRIFGLPFIPGSAVKGVTRNAALADIKERPERLETFVHVFGTAESDYKRGDLKGFIPPAGMPLDIKGAVTFVQALPTNEAQIVVDITTVHYPDYYRSGNESDQSRESPNPNPFPAVERGAEFAFPILLNGMSDDPALLEAAGRWLSQAMQQHGFGAKTAAGYGWFSDLTEEERHMARQERERQEQEQATAREREAAAHAEAARIEALSPEERINEATVTLTALNDQDFADKVKNIGALPEPEQRAMIRLFSTDKAKRDKLKVWRKKKPDNAKLLVDAATALGEKLP